MNRIKFLIATVFATMALTACTGIEDTPVIPDTPITDNVDDPQEEVTDQPANVREYFASSSIPSARARKHGLISCP